MSPCQRTAYLAVSRSLLVRYGLRAAMCLGVTTPLHAIAPTYIFTERTMRAVISGTAGGSCPRAPEHVQDRSTAEMSARECCETQLASAAFGDKFSISSRERKLTDIARTTESVTHG